MLFDSGKGGKVVGYPHQEIQPPGLLQSSPEFPTVQLG